VSPQTGTGVSSDVSPNDDLDLERVAPMDECDVILSVNQVIVDDVACLFDPELADIVDYFAFPWFDSDMSVEASHSVSRFHEQMLLSKLVDIPHFPLVLKKMLHIF
jgi:hypothetical protein